VQYQGDTRSQEQPPPPRWWADPRRAFLIGLGIGVIMLIVAAVAVHRDIEYAADHGLEVMTRWRPERAADIACLIKTIQTHPDTFSVEGEFDLVPPKTASNDWFVLRTGSRTREMHFGDGEVMVRAFPDDLVQPLDCG